MNRPDRTLSMIGLAIKAGKAARGAFAARQEVQNGRAALVVIARDASENTKKRFENLCRHYGVDYMFCGTCESLGRICRRDAMAVLAITDENLKKGVQKAAREQESQTENE